MQRTANVINPVVIAQSPDEDTVTDAMLEEEQAVVKELATDMALDYLNSIVEKDGNYFFGDGRPATRQAIRQYKRENN